MAAAWCQHSISVYVCVCLFFWCVSECALVSAQTKNNAAAFLGLGLLWLVGGMERRVTSPLVLNFSLFSCSDSTLTLLFFFFVPADDCDCDGFFM